MFSYNNIYVYKKMMYYVCMYGFYFFNWVFFFDFSLCGFFFFVFDKSFIKKQKEGKMYVSCWENVFIFVYYVVVNF